MDPAATRCLVTLLLAAAALPTAAQDVAGVVTATGGGPLGGARITLFDADTTFFREARSDADGAFAVSGVPPGTYTVGASLMGRAYLEAPVMVTAAGATADRVLGPETEPGRWDVIGDPGERLGGTNSGVLLGTGEVLWCHDTRDPVRFDPATGALTPAARSPRIQGCHAVGVLPDGRILYVGGHDVEVYGPGTRQVKTYDPAADAWTVQPEILDYRWYPTMAPLPGGTFLVAGGGGLDNPVRTPTTEVFDPRTMTSQPAGDLAVGNEVSPVVTLFTGEVLMTHRPPQLFNPTTRQWRLADDFVQGPRTPDGDHADHEMVMTADGGVVAIGYRSYGGPYLSLVERYDPVANQWRLGADRAPHRSRASLVLLPDERVLVLGGLKQDAGDPTPTNAWGYIALTELYDPAADAWRRVADLNVAREYHVTPILVPDGRVIVVGGEGAPGNEPEQSTIEAYSPPYLFRGVRPVLAGLTRTEFRRGEQVAFRVERTAAPTRVVLVGASANTHFMESGPGRHVDLPFTQAGADVVATLPADPARLLPGLYLLLVMTDDVPSVARLVRVLAEGTTAGEGGPEPVAFTLAAAPTPFDRETTVTFTLSREAPVRLEVYDVLGRLVRTLADERRGVGTHAVRWAGGAPAGAYYVRLAVDGRVRTRTVLLIR
jgi:hypothetical protein